MKVFLCLFVILKCASITISVDVYDLSFVNVLESQNGYGWPYYIYVLKGEEMLMKLTKDLVNHDNCTITTPDGHTFDIKEPPSVRFEQWDDCGVRVKNVTSTDEGRWKITSARSTDQKILIGIVELEVLSDYEDSLPGQLILQDGAENETLLLTNLPNAYCLVTQPYSTSTLIPGFCSVDLDMVSRALRGSWHVSIGAPGTVNEIHITKEVIVQGENLSAGYTHSSNTPASLNLYCNLINSSKNITFCRFQKVSSTSGYNLKDGLSDGLHSYYGKGFVHKECGITLERPTSEDYESWRCTVGVYEIVEGTVVDLTPLQALITPTHVDTRNLQVQTRQETNRFLIVERNTPMTLLCSSDAALSYCWFSDPYGNTYTPLDQSSEDQEYWATGVKSLGICGIVFKEALDSYAGLWSCHMGASSIPGLETTDSVDVRVAGAFLSDSIDMQVVLGEEATLYCHTTSRPRSLEYCRFRSPSLLGINIDETVTSDQAILDRYYFTPDRYLDYGQCSMTIKAVTQDDLGEWLCASTLTGDTSESMDTINLHIGSLESSATGRRTSTAGMAVGILSGIAVLSIVLGYVLWQKKKAPRQSTSSQVEMTTMRDEISCTSETSSVSGLGARNEP